MSYEAKSYDHLLGTEGFSDALLTNHFTLYQGYVKNTNAIIEYLDTKEAGTPEYAEMQRRLPWEFNGMRLHELYFGNMKNGGSSLAEGPLKAAIEKTYGSVENWQKAFTAVGTMRGIGWVVLYWDAEAQDLFSVWVNEHDVGHLAGCAPLLVMDVFEHAFMVDYGLKRADYINAFMNAIDWSVVSARFVHATHS